MYKDKTKSQHIIPYEFPSANQGDIWFSLDFSIGVWALESPRLYLGYMPIMLLFLIPVSEPQITLGSLTQTLPNFGPLICQQSSLCALSLCVSLPHAIANATRVYQPIGKSALGKAQLPIFLTFQWNFSLLTLLAAVSLMPPWHGCS